MKQLTLILILMLLPWASQSQGAGDFRSIQKYLDQAVTDGLSGVSVYIKGPRQSWSGTAGYANKSEMTSIRSSDMISLASVGKVYNAVAAFKLMESEQLQLDDPISKYLPATLVDHLPHGNEIKIKHLLEHTSGLVNYEYDSALNHLYLSGNLSLDTLSHLQSLERYVYGKEAFSRPGEEHHYSSTGYKLLAMIMDEVTGNHTDYLNELIASWGFNHTIYRTTPSGDMHYYGDLDQDEVQEDITPMTLETTNWFIGDDGVYATAEEAGRFMEHLLTGKILEERSLVALTQWNDARDPDYGRGVFADKSFPYRLTIGHSGRGIGSTADVYYFPKRQMTIAILSNTGLRSAARTYRDAYLKMRKRIIMKLFLF